MPWKGQGWELTSLLRKCYTQEQTCTQLNLEHMVGKLGAAGILQRKTCEDEALALRLGEGKWAREDFGGRTSTGVLNEGMAPRR